MSSLISPSILLYVTGTGFNSLRGAAYPPFPDVPLRLIVAVVVPGRQLKGVVI